MAISEFGLIRRYFADRATSSSTVRLGIGDDCAQVIVPEGQELVLSIDTMVENTHFLPGTPADLIAARLLAAATSDLAAMGATPAWFTLALTLPEADEHWLEPFAARLAEDAARYGLALVGGDTTRGPLALSIQVHGLVPGQGLQRGGAKPGDLIAVSGSLGDSRGGLQQLLDHGLAPEQPLQQRFFAPTPRLALGQGVLPFANSCIDISDGLTADLGHILTASQVGAELIAKKIPLSGCLREAVGENQALDWALSGGEDFELCFTLPETELDRLRKVAAETDTPVSVIGHITEARDYWLTYSDGRREAIKATGFDHFPES